MFYPLEAKFANKSIYFVGNKDLLCSYCCSLLEFYDPEKTEQRLEAPYFSLLAGLNAVKHNLDLDAALPKAGEAILDRCDQRELLALIRTIRIKREALAQQGKKTVRPMITC